jgi:hypothetical protein
MALESISDHLEETGGIKKFMFELLLDEVRVEHGSHMCGLGGMLPHL